MLIGSKQAPHLNHPNGLCFTGCLAILGKPTEKPPSGSRGHCLLLSESVVEAALSSLLYMPVNTRKPGGGPWHSSDNLVGVITWAETTRRELLVGGYLHSLYAPYLLDRLEPGLFGMSYELKDSIVEDQSSQVWKIVRSIFTGACILPKSEAAEPNTWFTV